MVRRQVDKIEKHAKEIADIDIVNKDAEYVFVSYGAPTRTVRQLLYDKQDKNTGHLNIRTVWPFPAFALDEFANAKAFIIPEMNLGQIAKELRQHTNVSVVTVPKLGGALHTPSELEKALSVAKTAKKTVTEVRL